MTLSVSIVIPAWNSASVLPACLRSLDGQGHTELIIIDNASVDGSASLAQELAPHARVISLTENTGFSGASNLGIESSSNDYVLLLNDDAVLRPGYVAGLCATLESEQGAASAVGKLIYEEAGQTYIDSAGIELCAYALRPGDRGQGQLDRGQYDEPTRVFGASAAAALYRRSALLELGEAPFDPDLFAYYEDVDLAWRLARRGWSHQYVPSVQALHSRRGPDEKPPAIRARAFSNRYVVWAKNETLARFTMYGPLACSWELARLVRRAVVDPELLQEVPAALERAAKILRQRFSDSWGPKP